MTGVERMEWCAAHCTGEFHEQKCPIAKLLRTEWCTPKELTDRLPTFDLDPCSNERSTVPARRRCCGSGDGEFSDDGLRVSWRGLSVFANPPYDDLLPWAEKAADARAFVFLVNVCPDTAWWKALVKSGGWYRFDFAKRLQFAPPPRIKPSTNQRPSCLVCNEEGGRMVSGAVVDLGQWWTVNDAVPV